jgi:lipopolysaccharide export system permease protein
MKIINRYILKSHLAPFIFGSSTVIFLFLFQFLIKYIDLLLGKGLSNWIIIQLIVYNLSWMVVLAVPMGVLFSTLMTFGAMSASQEITIIKSSGGSLIKMMAPLIISGTVLSYLLFVYNDYVLPQANHQAKDLLNDIKRKKPTFALEEGQFSTQIDGFTILARQMDSASGAIKGVTIYDNTGNRNKSIISSDSGFIYFNEHISKLVMDLTDGEIVQYLDNKINNMKVINFKTFNVNFKVAGFSLERTEDDNSSKGDREMTISEMRAYVNDAQAKLNKSDSVINSKINSHLDYLLGKVTRKTTPVFTSLTKDEKMSIALTNSERNLNILKAGIFSESQMRNTYLLQEKKYLVEIYKKYSIPFACLIFVFVGCPLGVMTKGGNFGISAGISLGFYILYWACLIGGEKIADRALLSPLLSMWMGNIIVGILGIILTLKVNNENFKLSSILYKITNMISIKK